MSIEPHLYQDPFWSLVLVFGVNLALPLCVALGFLVMSWRYEGDERYLFRWVARWMVATAVVMQLLAGGYHLRQWVGTVEHATVAEPGWRAGGRTPHCVLPLETPHGALKVSVHQGECDRQGVGATVPLVMVGESTWFAQVGEQAMAHALLIFGLGPMGMLGMLGFVFYASSKVEDEGPKG